MAKKTFEHTIKISINTTDLQHQFYWSLRDRVDDKLMNKFYKTVDWDAILNSTKFNKAVKDCFEDGNTYTDEMCGYFFDVHEAEYNKIKRAYDKFVLEHEKKQPILTKEYKLTIYGTVSDMEKALKQVEEVTGVSLDNID